MVQIPGAETVKGIAQVPNSDSLVVLRLEPLTSKLPLLGKEASKYLLRNQNSAQHQRSSQDHSSSVNWRLQLEIMTDQILYFLTFNNGLSWYQSCYSKKTKQKKKQAKTSILYSYD